MTHTPCPAGQHATLVLRLGEAVLEGVGWRAVADALAMELGPGLAIRTGSLDPAGRHRPLTGRIALFAPGIGSWTLDLPADCDDALAAALPLREAFALATQLRRGLRPARPDLESLLDPLPYAILLLDQRARLLFANTAGDDVLASRGLFRPARAGAPLAPSRRRADEAFDAALARVLLEDEPDARWIVRAPDGTHLVIHLRAVGPDPAPAGAVRVVVTLRSIGAAEAASYQPEHDPSAILPTKKRAASTSRPRF